MPSEKRPLTRPRPAGLSDILTPSDSLAYRKPVFLPSPGLDNMLKCVYTPSMQDQTRQSDLPAGIEAALFCACFNLRKTARAITQFYNAMLQPCELLATQFTLLAILARDNPSPISALADALGMDRTTLARNLKPLQRDGLVQVAPDEQDRRIQLVALTFSGRERLLAALPLWQQAQQQIVAQFGADRFTALLADLSSMVALTQT